jgi:hypothetical protein
LDEIQIKKSSEFSSLLFFQLTQPLTYFFKFKQSLTYFYCKVPVHVKEKGGKPDRKPYPLLYYVLRNPYKTSRLKTLKIMPRNLNKIVR